MALLKKQFPTGRFYAPATPFLLGCRKLMEDSPGFTMFVNVQQKSLDIALFEKQKLQFFNTFPCTGAPDVLYYTLLTYNQFGLDATQIPLNLSGAIIESTATEVKSVMSFYSTYSSVPTGKYHLQVCMTLSCLRRVGRPTLSRSRSCVRSPATPALSSCPRLRARPPRRARRSRTRRLPGRPRR